MFRKILSSLLVLQIALPPVLTGAAPVIPGLTGASAGSQRTVAPDALPQRKGEGVVPGIGFEQPEPTQLVIRQEKDPATGSTRAVIEWKSFDIGEAASVHFDQQKNTDWMILNRIYDQNPSQIMGRLSADGRIYLINQNGILFGPNSQINVHSLTASTLNLQDPDFLAGQLRFRAENYIPEQLELPANAAVVNQGTIAAQVGGKVFLLGRQAANEGRIAAPAGQIGLAAGADIEIRQPDLEDTQRIAVGSYVDVKAEPGEVRNAKSGELLSDLGTIGLYGGTVEQDGIARAATSAQKSGRIEMQASEKISTGAQSWTATPVSISEEKFVGEKETASIQLKGLQTGSVGDKNSTARRVEHRGVIDAPSGRVEILAGERVYLESGSRIDVSGVRLDQEGEANVLETQLNSLQLRDDFGQKDGILKGRTIRFTAQEGSAIGNVSGALEAREKTALEQSTAGGTIDILAGAGEGVGDVILREGAELNFSGGGIHFDSGTIETTKLVSGRRVYDISEAPQWLRYDKVLTSLDYGGATPLWDYVSDRYAGSDAGTLTVVAPRVVLDGVLAGAAEAGIGQDYDADPSGLLGVRRPQPGTLILGREPAANNAPEERDAVLEAVVIRAETDPLPDGFGAEDPLTAGPSVLSTEAIGTSGIGHLQVHVNTETVIEADARLHLPAGGSFQTTARRIEHAGEIRSAGGTVQMEILDNSSGFAVLGGRENPAFRDLQQRISLGEGSRIDVAGERIDNIPGRQGTAETAAITAGGEIRLLDKTHDLASGEAGEVVVAAGAALDVGGGYVVDPAGKIVAGDAGTLEMRGGTVVTEGEMRGLALPGRKGGKIILHADRVTVAAGETADTLLPEEQHGTLVLAADALDDSGFTQLELNSFADTVVEAGARLAPSTARLASPVPGESMAAQPVGNRVEPPGAAEAIVSEHLGYASVVIRSGVAVETSGREIVVGSEPTTLVAAGAVIETAPGGKIEIRGPHVDVAGRLEAPGGKVTVTADTFDIALRDGSELAARGYNAFEKKPLANGLPLGAAPRDGGEVVLSAKNGKVAMEVGAVVDVSGSAPVTGFTRRADGLPVPVTVAGNPGSVKVEYNRDAELAGTFRGKPRLEGLRGGSFEVLSRDPAAAMPVTGGQIQGLTGEGFDDLAFRAFGGIAFVGDVDARIGRRLTLDAPRIAAEDAGSVALQAPWMRLVNRFAPAADAPGAGEARLSLAGDWLDVVGDIQLSGFRETRLEAAHDLRVSDFDYKVSTFTPFDQWQGRLESTGDIVLKAQRIYPQVPDDFARDFAKAQGAEAYGFPADFTLSSGGRITTLPGGTGGTSPIYSAGGHLRLEAAEGIDHRGVLAAPMGTIELVATGENGRVFLAPESRLTVAGEVPVPHGSVQNDIWYRTDKETREKVEITAAPEKGITASGQEIIVAEGAVIDVSGGGELFGYQFQPGIEGSFNPLAGKMVIVPDNSIRYPGTAVHLSGIEGLPEGTYSVLPAEYAFLENALVLIDLGTAAPAGGLRLTEQGYPIVRGYETVQGTDLRAPLARSYAVRRAGDVLKEGNFSPQSLTAGDGGDISLQAPTTVVNGTLRAAPLPGFRGGSVSLSGENILVNREGASLPAGFDFGSALPDGVQGRLTIADSAVSGQGFGEIALGNLAITRNLTLEEGTVLQAEKVTLAGRETVLLKSGARVDAVADGGEGEANLISPDGQIVLEEGAVVHATDAINLSTSDLDYRGEFLIDNPDGQFNLTGKRITFLQQQERPVEPGIYVSNRLWSDLSRFRNIGLHSDSDLIFQGDHDLRVGDRLDIRAARVAGDGGTVSVTAGRISLANAGAASTDGSLVDTGTLNLIATKAAETGDGGTIDVGPGEIRTDGFGNVNLTAGGDLTFKGQGKLTTEGDLTMTAARVTVAGVRDGDDRFQAADFTIDAGAGSVAVLGNGTAAPVAGEAGGRLEIKGGTVEVGGIIDNTAGTVALTASGNGPASGVFVREGGQVLARGNEHFEAGQIVMRAEGGTVQVAAASALAGGSLAVDAGRIDEQGGLNAQIAAGGFERKVEVRTRTGDLAIAAGETVRAREVRLSADAGNVTVAGTIDASSAARGGSVELNAGTDLNLAAGSRVRAVGLDAGADGGSVALNARDGWVRFQDGAEIEVSGNGGAGGEVLFRAGRGAEPAGVNLDLQGTVIGASRVTAEGVKVYNDSSIGAAQKTTYLADARTYMADAAQVRDGLLAGLALQDPAIFHFRPGIEVQSTGNLTVSAWDLTQERFDGEAGALTLRAQGDLTVSGSLNDSPTPVTPLGRLNSATAKDSWAITLVAGADGDSADPLATVSGQGDLKVNDGVMVYSEKAPVRFASGRDTTIGKAPTLGKMASPQIRHSLGSYAGQVEGRVGRDLIIRNGAIQTATGDIALEVGRDLVLKADQDFGSTPAFQSLGSIRTLGETQGAPRDFWTFADGGDIEITAGGSVRGGLATNAWDFAYGSSPPYRWSASYEGPNTTEGLATLGGGSLRVEAGKDFFAQAGAFGEGDLDIRIGGDLGGRFQTRAGRADFQVLGNLGSDQDKPVFELFDARLDARVQGDILAGAIVNPTLVLDKFTSKWNLGYTPDTAVRMTSVAGDITLIGDSSFHSPATDGLETFLPATVELDAGRDLRLTDYFAMAPSPAGNLKLLAGRDLLGRYGSGVNDFARILMSDADPATVYGEQPQAGSQLGAFVGAFYATDPPTRSSLLHAGDEVPVEVRAGRDISSLYLRLPKTAEVTAGRDIRYLGYVGQNLPAADGGGVSLAGLNAGGGTPQQNLPTANDGRVSLIRAGRDLKLEAGLDDLSLYGIEQGGPGTLIVQAGNNLDLGSSGGIRAYGGEKNVALGSAGSDVLVIAGYDRPIAPEEAAAFFGGLQEEGKAYTLALAAGKTAEALEYVAAAREKHIAPLLGEAPAGEGNIDMVQSLIRTSGDDGDIFVIGGGDLNVGRSAIGGGNSSDTGIATTAGGGVYVYSQGDLNVNESRVMTFGGGDILAWADSGGINAGRGSRTSISRAPMKVEYNEETMELVRKFAPPAVGSGIRALTFDPDGVEGPLAAPEPGDIYLFAPDGEIDPGEAGVIGGTIYVGGKTVVDRPGGWGSPTVGVPTASGAGSGLGAMAGVSNLGEASSFAQEAAQLGARDERMAAGLADSVISKWLDVEVVGFETDQTEEDGEEKP